MRCKPPIGCMLDDVLPEKSGVQGWPVLQLRRKSMKRSRFTEEQIIGILKQH